MVMDIANPSLFIIYSMSTVMDRKVDVIHSLECLKPTGGLIRVINQLQLQWYQIFTEGFVKEMCPYLLIVNI